MKSLLVKQPVITERSLQRANEENIYTFVVAKEANKNQIKNIIEHAFKVNVVAVRTITMPDSQRKTGKKRQSVLVTGSKKALVKIKEGQTISAFDISK